mgnify:CR=1 FL=1
MVERPFLSIGEVLAVLLEEFPDVTISKIRFLEAQGLVEPERTSSGYRKFYDDDVERLRYVLKEQKDNFLPLRVIKGRLDDDASGAITGPVEVPTGSVLRRHPATHEPKRRQNRLKAIVPDPTLDTPRAYTKADLLEESGITELQLAELIRFSIIRDRGHDLFDARDAEIAAITVRFGELGIDVRHLKSWVMAVDKEAALYEQRMLPMMRQRNPEAHRETLAMLDEMKELSARLHGTLLHRAVGETFKSL